MSKRKKASDDNVVKTPKKKRGGMSDVLHESVASAALDIFKNNTDFVVPSDEPRYVGLLLNVDDIGGLSKKDRRNEDKGQIIEAITAGHIAVYISEEMLQQERIVFIPTSDTVDRMNEYAPLRSAEYRVVLVNDDAEIEETEKTVSLSDIIELYEDNTGTKFPEFVGQFDSSDDEFEDISDDVGVVSEPADIPVAAAPVEAPVETVPESTYEGPAFGDDASLGGDVPPYAPPVVSSEPPVGVPSDDAGFVPGFDDSGYGDPLSEYPDYEGEPITDENEEGEPDVEVVGDENAVLDTITRRFYSDDLGLEVSTEPFDIQFIKNDTVVPFDENRPSNWLNDYLNQRSVEANAELKHLHAQNLQALRERYLTLVALHCERIEKDLDLESEDSRYGRQVRRIMTEALKEQKSIGNLVSAKRDELVAEWNAKLDETAARAAEDARREYSNRYGESHQAQLLRIEPDMKQEIDQKATERKRGLYEDRRREAARLLDAGINEILVELSGMHADMVLQENERRKELQQSIQAFADEHRKDDIARTHALAEELAQAEKADKVAKEYSEKMRAQTVEFKAKREADLADIARIREKSEAALADKDAEHQKTVAAMKAQIEELKADNAKLMDNYVNLDKKNQQEYEGRINQLQNDKAAVEDSLEHVRSTHKRSSRMAIIAAIVAAIATLAVGLVIGYYGGTHVADDVVSKVDEQYRSQIPTEAATIALEAQPQAQQATQPKVQARG